MKSGSLGRALAIRVAIAAALLALSPSMTSTMFVAEIGAIWAFVAVIRLAFRKEAARQASAIASFILLAGSIASCNHKQARLEAAFAPTLSALEAFHKENGDYPPDLKTLVPKYLTSLPDCSLAGEQREPFYRPHLWGGGSGFYIDCSWGMVGHYYYSSGTREWDNRGG